MFYYWFENGLEEYKKSVNRLKIYSSGPNVSVSRLNLCCLNILL